MFSFLNAWCIFSFCETQLFTDQKLRSPILCGKKNNLDDGNDDDDECKRGQLSKGRASTDPSGGGPGIASRRKCPLATFATH